MKELHGKDKGNRAVDAVIGSLMIGMILLTWRNETLNQPPFQDQAVGYWAEASYLARTGFDYYRLLYQENHYMDTVSGPRSYMISIVPTAVAVLMRLSTEPMTAIIWSRLISFVFGGFIVYQVFSMMIPRLGRWNSFLLTTAMATLPAFITQIELIGMDVPLAAAILVSMLYLIRHQFVLSGIWSFIAFSIKATGQLMSLVAITYLLLQLLPSRGSRRQETRTLLAAALVGNVALFIVESMIIGWGDTSVKYLAVDPWPAILKPYFSMAALTPDVGIILVVATVSVVRFLMAESLFGNRERDLGGDGRSDSEDVGNRSSGSIGLSVVDAGLPKSIGPLEFIGRFQEDRLLAVSSIFVVGLMASSFLYIYTPRYVFCAIPPLFMLLGIGGLQARESAGSMKWILMALIGWNLWNADGRFLPSVPEYGRADFEETPGLTARSCVFVERSREYLVDHWSTQEAIRRIEREWRDHPVFAPVVFRFLLEDPRLGHVRQKVNVRDATVFEFMIEEFVSLYGPASSNEGLSPVFVWYAHSRATVPPMAAGDELIYQDQIEPTLQVYSKRVPAEVKKSRRQLEEWFLDQTWDETWVVARVLERFNYLRRTGRMDRLRRELAQALRERPNDPVLIDRMKAMDGDGSP
jgi:hypothetical protein